MKSAREWAEHYFGSDNPGYKVSDVIAAAINERLEEAAEIVEKKAKLDANRWDATLLRIAERIRALKEPTT